MEEKEIKCVFCGRILKDKASIRRKCGPDCLRKNQPKRKKLIKEIKANE